MKRSIILSVLGTMFIFCSIGMAAEHQVNDGEVIGMISEKVGCSVPNLAQFNNIASPAYIVRKGEVLKYVSAQDLQDARAWAEEYLSSRNPQDEDYADLEQVVADIDANTIEYGSGKNHTHASEILLLADTFRSR